MNNIPEPGEHRSLQILTELSTDDSLTQRDLSSRLGIALGLVNSYIRNLMAKGFITVKSIPPRRYAYFLTPKGFTEKTRLTYHLLQDYTRIYREARANLKRLFADLRIGGARRVVFAGADEVAEIAFLTLQETDIELAGIVDEEMAGKKFLGRDVRPLSSVNSGEFSYDYIVITSYLKKEMIYKKLLDAGTPEEHLKVIFSIQ
ncbi:MAG: winged helix-turn-helix transcriptional regulator [Nitrospirae bacterium]|nr:winged helix-turn-helix transcriptional regulator [Nitrospirota bacterium]